MKVSIRKLKPNTVLPNFATTHAAGMDISACIDEPITLQPHERAIVPAGFAIALPVGYEAQVRGRSGLAARHGIMPANGVGTIDADYRGEIGVILLNTSNETFIVEPDMRIAQLVIAKYEAVEWDLVEVLDETDRGSDGYGSTGK